MSGREPDTLLYAKSHMRASTNAPNTLKVKNRSARTKPEKTRTNRRVMVKQCARNFITAIEFGLVGLLFGEAELQNSFSSS